MSRAKLGAADPNHLAQARLVIHWAAQIVSAAGTGRLPAKDDSSHTNLGWSHDLDALVTHPLGGGEDGGVVAGLVPGSLELFVARGGSAVANEPLRGKTLEQGLAWLKRALDDELDEQAELTLPEHDMPEHPVSDGGVFPAPDGPAYAEIGQWFHLAHHLLAEVASHNRDRAPAPRCWPHHFDIATLITVERHDDAEKAKSVGVGMTPGDDGYTQPYFYVTPWPYPEKATLPELRHGRWHTDGWMGAVLTATESLANGDVTTRARAFIDDALAVNLAMLTG
ncbi:MAG: hypothetical protein RIF41_27480 [Polyangiaceae bacterium]